MLTGIFLKIWHGEGGGGGLGQGLELELELELGLLTVVYSLIKKK